MPDERTTALVRAPTRDAGLIANVALLYYGEGLTQSEIARRIGLSRASVVNYLRAARDEGIVEIRVRGDALARSAEGRALCARYRLTDAYVALDPGGDAQAALQRTARVGAMALIDLLAPGDALGVSWGQTIRALAEEMPTHPLAHASVCQLIGAARTPRLAAAEACAIEIARHLRAECHTLHAPAVLATPELAAALRADPAVAGQLERLERLDAVVFSVGDCGKDTHVLSAGIATHADLEEARGKGAVAVICGRFVDAEGKGVGIELDRRLIGAPLSALTRAPKRMLVASGVAKAGAVRAALAGGHVTHLVTDQALARCLLDR